MTNHPRNLPSCDTCLAALEENVSFIPITKTSKYVAVQYQELQLRDLDVVDASSLMPLRKQLCAFRCVFLAYGDMGCLACSLSVNGRPY